MGQRCNLIVIENGRIEIFYDHWAANRLDEVVFWGPKHTKAFCRQRDVDPNPLLDTVWAEGGLVLDCDKSVLIWYGGEDVMNEPFDHHVFNEILPENWPNWEVSWAVEGQLDIARYIGIPDNQILSSNDCFEGPFKLPVVNEYEGGKYLEASVLVSYTDAPGVISSLLDGQGDVILPLAKSDPKTMRELIKSSTIVNFPNSIKTFGDWSGLRGGIHFDYESKLIKIWHSSPESGALDLLKSNWPEWTIEIDPDFNWHKALLPKWSWNLIKIPDPKNMRQMYERKVGIVQPNPAVELAKRMAKDGQEDVQISAATFENRNYYSPKKSNIWNRLKGLIGKATP